MDYLTYLIMIIFLFVIALAIVHTRKKDFKIKVNKLVDSLGGQNNIVDYEFNKSRFIVTLKDVNLANKSAIQKMGAKGIVEIENQLKIILDNNAIQLKKYIKELK